MKRNQAVWPIVMMREIVVKLRDRNFLIGTGITLVLLAGGLAFQAVFAGKANELTASVSGDGARAVMQQVQQTATQRDDNLKLTITDAPDRSTVDAAVSGGRPTSDSCTMQPGGSWSARRR